MENVKVLVCGIGNVGGHLVNLLAQKKGIEMVAAIDIDPAKIGTDAGLVTGDKEIGLVITDDLVAACKEYKPQLVIATTTPTDADKVFEELEEVIAMGISVLVPNMGTSNLWVSDPELAKRIDEACKATGASYFALGATQVQDRFILACTEGCESIEKIDFTHFADMHAFSDDSIRHEWGVLLTEEEFWKGLEDGSVLKHEYFGDGIYYLGDALGWKIKKVDYNQYPLVNEEGRVWSCNFDIKGYDENGDVRIETHWVFCRDPEKKYYDEVEVHGVPYIDAVCKYTPDRGIVSTYAALANAIPYAINCEAGYQNTLAAPICTLVDDEYGNHIK